MFVILTLHFWNRFIFHFKTLNRMTMATIFLANFCILLLLFITSSSVDSKPSSLFYSSENSQVDWQKNASTLAETFDAFISYRRSVSKNLAMLIKVLLERENVSAFLDVEDLKGGIWADQLYQGIENAPNFVLVLGNGTLDRCRGDVNYTDFLHKEIKDAVDGEKQIVLVFDDFDFPSAEDFSPEIQKVLDYQGLTLVWEHALVEGSIQRLVSYLMTGGPVATQPPPIIAG